MVELSQPASFLRSITVVIVIALITKIVWTLSENVSSSWPLISTPKAEALRALERLLASSHRAESVWAVARLRA